MRRRLAVGAAALVALLVGTQLVLPRIAEQRLRDELSDHGAVVGVDVAAFPALKLLLGRADKVDVHLAEAALAGGRLADLVDRTRSAGEVDARVDTLSVGPLVVRDLRLRKDGDRLHSEASLTDADLRAALPADLGLRPVRTGTDGLVLEARALGFAVQARLSADDGALVIAPAGLLGGLATLTLFDDARVRVTSVGARPRADGFTMVAEARLA